MSAGRRSDSVFARVVEGELETQQRGRCEAALFERLEAAAVGVALLSIDDEGCSFAIDARDAEALRDAIRPLNAALRLTTACASVRVSGCNGLVRGVGRIVSTLNVAGIAIEHFVAEDRSFSVVVDKGEAHRAAAVLASYFRISSRAA